MWILVFPRDEKVIRDIQETHRQTLQRRRMFYTERRLGHRKQTADSITSRHTSARGGERIVSHSPAAKCCNAEVSFPPGCHFRIIRDPISMEVVGKMHRDTALERASESAIIVVMSS